jgi:hypothetical protein
MKISYPHTRLREQSLIWELGVGWVKGVGRYYPLIQRVVVVPEASL